MLSFVVTSDGLILRSSLVLQTAKSFMCCGNTIYWFALKSNEDINNHTKADLWAAIQQKQQLLFFNISTSNVHIAFSLQPGHLQICCERGNNCNMGSHNRAFLAKADTSWPEQGTMSRGAYPKHQPICSLQYGRPWPRKHITILNKAIGFIKTCYYSYPRRVPSPRRDTRIHG